MKRIVLLGLIGFILTGCGDDKVTKEYLVGDWRCNGIRYKSIMEDGKFSEYMKNGNINFNLSFKLDNNELYKLNDDSKEWNLNDFIDKYTGEVLFEELEGAKLKFKGTAEKVSDNEFKVDDEYIMTRNDTRYNYLDDKVKTTSVCIRIK